MASGCVCVAKRADLCWGVLGVIILRLVVVAVASSGLVVAPGGVVARVGLLLVLAVLIVAGSVS